MAGPSRHDSKRRPPTTCTDDCNAFHQIKDGTKARSPASSEVLGPRASRPQMSAAGANQLFEFALGAIPQPSDILSVCKHNQNSPDHRGTQGRHKRRNRLNENIPQQHKQGNSNRGQD